MAGHFYVKTRAFVDTAATGDGTVIENRWKAARRNGGAFYPRVRFQTADGRQVTFQSNSGAKPASYRLGDRVKVLYSQQNPEDAQIESFVSLWLLPLGFGGLGLIFASVSLGPPLFPARASRS